MHYIIWAYTDYYYVLLIFFQGWSNEVVPLKLFKCALPSVIELLNKFFLILHICILYMTITHDTCFFLQCFIVPVYDWLPGTVLIKFLLCVLFLFSVIALDRQILCELFFPTLNLGLVFVIWLTIRLSIDFVNLLAKDFLVTLN